jgi:hypothetical protein
VILTLHLHGPPGEATRRLVSKALEAVRQDNIYVVEAMLNSGYDVPDTMWDLGVAYDPPSPNRPVFDDYGNLIAVVDEVNTPTQDFWGLLDIIERGRFSCGDGAAAEAAIMQVKHGVPTRCECVAQGGYEYHAIFFGPDGPVDPSERWLEAQARSQGRGYKPSLDNQQRLRRTRR